MANSKSNSPRSHRNRRPTRDQTKINELIRSPEVRVIGENGEQVGVLKIADALAYAQDRDLDLVEIASGESPPVCRVLNYSKYKYEQEQKAKSARRSQKQSKVREIKLRVKIADNDFETKKSHVRRFLTDGAKVKVTIMFRGREMAHPNLGIELLERLAGDIEDLGTMDAKPSLNGKNMVMTLSPVKSKTP